MNNLTINTSPEIKMSELISEYASDYINMGENTKERQSYLNGACTAWNIANLDEKHREEAIRGVIEGYKRTNPGTDDAENLEQDLRKLIQKKLEMFPDIKKAIIDAMIEPISETKYRINIASTDDKELLKEILKKERTL
jgi:tryptophanyl-tRNA synthetase